MSGQAGNGPMKERRGRYTGRVRRRGDCCWVRRRMSTRSCERMEDAGGRTKWDGWCSQVVRRPTLILATRDTTPDHRSATGCRRSQARGVTSIRRCHLALPPLHENRHDNGPRRSPWPGCRVRISRLIVSSQNRRAGNRRARRRFTNDRQVKGVADAAEDPDEIIGVVDGPGRWPTGRSMFRPARQRSASIAYDVDQSWRIVKVSYSLIVRPA